jgi:4-hydroxybenzoate polyprenyltransferase
MAPLFAGLLGVLSTVSINFHTFLMAIYVGVTLALAQAAGQIINQYADIELDKKIKPYRPLPSGILTREEALGLAWLLAIISIARAFTISVEFGLIDLLLIFFAVFYSLSPFSPRKINSFYNVFWMAFSRGFVPILAVWSIYGNWKTAMPYAILCFFWVLAFQATKDVEDVEGDKVFGIKTIYGQYGRDNMQVWMGSFALIYAILAFDLHFYLMLTLVPLAVFAVFGTFKKSRLTENNYGWVAFYSGLALFFLLMLLNENFLA